jgi:hypothetical protein
MPKARIHPVCRNHQCGAPRFTVHSNASHTFVLTERAIHARASKGCYARIAVAARKSAWSKSCDAAPTQACEAGTLGTANGELRRW